MPKAPFGHPLRTSGSLLRGGRPQPLLLLRPPSQSSKESQHQERHPIVTDHPVIFLAKSAEFGQFTYKGLAAVVVNDLFQILQFLGHIVRSLPFFQGTFYQYFGHFVHFFMLFDFLVNFVVFILPEAPKYVQTQPIPGTLLQVHQPALFNLLRLSMNLELLEDGLAQLVHINLFIILSAPRLEYPIAPIVLQFGKDFNFELFVFITLY